ncbi:MAG: right-handed parallel beta-helix repeat-containing protein, partial [Planctomycetaceae bacterium]|nr:right-handed parallel beta-helix repeat-containing protein [Planctomycetaceae bacterium]
TPFLKAALDSKVPRLIVDKQIGPWITGPLRLHSDLELVFEEGTEVFAKAGQFQGLGDTLFMGLEVKNVKFTGLGKGAVLRMRKADYHTEAYKKSEWRHGIALMSAENIRIENISIVATGGDGIYLGEKTKGIPCRNITIRNVICDDNNRQGISIISADHLLIEDCVLKNTKGTPPAAGIDFEPNTPDNQLTDCVVRRCVIENNAGDGIVFAIIHLTKSSKPISIRVEQCVVKGSTQYGFNFVNQYGFNSVPGDKAELMVTGSCEAVDCRFEKCAAGGIQIDQKATDGVTVTLKNTEIIDCGENEKSAPIAFSANYIDHFGNIDLGSIRVVDDKDRCPVKFSNYLKHPKQITGNSPFPVIWLRRQGTFWIYAEKGSPLYFAAAVRQCGQSKLGINSETLTFPNGNIEKLTIPAESANKFEYKIDSVAETGVYVLHFEVGYYAVRLIQCNQPVFLAAPQFNVFASLGKLYLTVPPESKEFGIRIKGGELGEAVGVKIVDPAGTTVWSEDTITDGVQFDQTAEQRKIDGVWQIILEKPSRLTLEDFSIMILGVPPLLSFR